MTEGYKDFKLGTIWAGCNKKYKEHKVRSEIRNRRKEKWQRQKELRQHPKAR
jgi:hypothetical protein